MLSPRVAFLDRSYSATMSKCGDAYDCVPTSEAAEQPTKLTSILGHKLPRAIQVQGRKCAAEHQKRKLNHEHQAEDVHMFT